MGRLPQIASVNVPRLMAKPYKTDRQVGVLSLDDTDYVLGYGSSSTMA
jgi:hypothetical protein